MSNNQKRFTATWHAEAPRVLAYARRHVGAQEAPDLVSETFAVAWRRWDVVLDPPTAWLIGTARKIISSHHRSRTRRIALSQRLRLLEAVATPPTDPWRREEALYRLAALTEQHREALLLTGWDGLSAEDASSVLGISQGAFRKRIQRARDALDDTLSLVLTKEIR